MARPPTGLAAAALVALALAAQAQQKPPLDLRLQTVTEGVVISVREIHVSKPAPPAQQGQLAAPPESLDQGPLVGAVVYRPIGAAPSEEKKWRFGAAGTPEMQARLAQTGYEVSVRMDDGESRVFRPADAQRFRVGQRVTLRSGELQPLGKDGI